MHVVFIYVDYFVDNLYINGSTHKSHIRLHTRHNVTRKYLLLHNGGHVLDSDSLDLSLSRDGPEGIPGFKLYRVSEMCQTKDIYRASYICVWPYQINGTTMWCAIFRVPCQWEYESYVVNVKTQYRTHSIP